MKKEKSSTGNIGRGRYEADIIRTTQEIEYLEGIKHPRHADMIQQRKQHVKKLKEKLKLT